MARLRLRHLLVTGGAGFIGSAFVRERLRADPEIRLSVLDKLTYAGSEENLGEARNDQRLRFVQGDICDPSLVDEASAGVDLVFHQAALRITQCAEDPIRAVQVMVNGTQNVLESAVRHRAAKVLLASSASVYGEPDRLPNHTTPHAGAKR